MVFILVQPHMPTPIFRRQIRLPSAGWPVAGVLFAASMGAYGQDAESAPELIRAVVVVPRVSVTETFTDNINLVDVSKRSDQVTEISPGIRITRKGGGFTGFFDYALIGVGYAQNSLPSHTQNALNTFGTLEAIEKWAYLDFNGSIAQQSISAFGTPSNQNSSINTNRTEVSSYRVSPYLRGNLGNLANYEARYSQTVVHGDASSVSGVTTTDGSLFVSGSSALKSLGWSADVSQQDIAYSAGRPTEAATMNLGLSYAVTPQLSVLANAGREASNYTSLDKQNYSTNSVGFSWLPSERTRLTFSQGHRSFGENHSLIFEQRTALTLWKFTDSQDVSAAPSQTLLLLNNTNPAAPVISSFLSAAVSIQRRQDLSLSLFGVRDTITFVASNSENRRLDTISTAVDDLLAAQVHQLGFSIDYLHRLTPEYSLGIFASQQKTWGGLGLQDTNFHYLNWSLTGKTGKNTSATLGLRRAVYDSVAPYAETALSINLNVQF